MSQSRQRVRNAADREQVESADKKQKREAQRYLDALNNTMNTKDGRIVMSTFLRACGIGIGEKTSTAFNNSGAITAYQCGQQDIGFDLQEALKRANLNLYHLMESEARPAEPEETEDETETDNG